VERWEPAAQWAERMFAGVELGDVRRTRRLVKAATRIAERPEGSLPSKFDWNELRGVYRLMNRPEATHAQILEPHYRQVREEMSRHPVVLIVHDTTELDFTSHRALRGSGSVGWGGRGLLQHNSLAILPEGQLLGLACQQIMRRQSVPARETHAQRRNRKRESELWLNGIRAVGQAPQDGLWVHVADRGSDIFDAMHEARQLGHHFLFRAAQNRIVLVGPPGQQVETYLLTHARQLTAQITDTIQIASRGGRPAREARIALAAEELWICPPWPESRRSTARPPERVWVVRIWEPDPPADCQALEWVLLSSLPAGTDDELRACQRWYELRWPTAEDFHQVEKTGCGEEDLRFETVEAMQPMLAVLSIVAVRMMQLREAERRRPEDPATSVASPIERQLIAAASRGRLSPEQMTVREFVRGVARLGGYLNRRRDGSPGWKTLWRGYQRLQQMIEGAELLTNLHEPSSTPRQRARPTTQKCW
jgi:hypothetical protein